MIPPPTHYSFHDSFWTSTSPLEPHPKFSHGLSTLHTKLAQSMEENKTILQYLSQRIRAEEQYAQTLDSIMANDNKMDDIFSRDMGASLKQCYQVVRTESKSSAEAHLSRATNLITTALDPVERMAAKYTKIIDNSKSVMTTLLTQFDSQARIALDAQQDYINKCKKVLTNNPSYRPSHDIPVLLGNKSWHRNDLVLILERLQQTHHPLLGQNILDEMMANYKNDTKNEDAMLACQQLLTQEWIVGATFSNPHITTFSTSPDITYTICSTSSNAGSSMEDLSSTNSTTSSSSVTTSLGFWSRQRWTGSSLKPSDSSFQLLCQNMNMADLVYKNAVQKAESLRMEVEENLFMHFEEMECLELERIQTLKQAFISMAAAFSNTIPVYKDIYDRMMLYQETLRPDKDIQAIVEQYRTSRFCPRPILYENYFSPAASAQLFGVPLEDLCSSERTQVPLLITNGLTVIESELLHLCNEERQKVWITPLPLDLIHKTRNELNSMNGLIISQDTLRKYNVLLLASTLWLYLLELPECLATFELYDTLKLLYANQNQLDMECHLLSIGKLMTTLPSANYETLKSLLYHLKRVINMINDSAALTQTLIHRFTHIIIRPDLITPSNRHDRHPHRFVRDLIEHVDVIFSKEVDQGQVNHQIRQQQRAMNILTVPTSRQSSLEFNVKLPSLDSSSVASTISNSYPNSEETTLFAKEQQHQPIKEKEDNGAVVSSSPPVRRRSLMSFVRRSSTTANDAGRPDQPNPSRRPIPMPSTSTLFEDPEEIDLAPKWQSSSASESMDTPATSLPPSDGALSKDHPLSHPRVNDEDDYDDDVDDDDNDHISLDSFFL